MYKNVQCPPVNFLELYIKRFHGLYGLLLGHFLCYTTGVLGGDFFGISKADPSGSVIEGSPEHIPVGLALNRSIVVY